MNRIALSLLILCAAGFAAAAAPSSTTVGGRVCGPDSEPLAGVTVSDGFSCATTDSAGRYSLSLSPLAAHVWVSTPAGYLPPLDGCVPRFFTPVEQGRAVYDFSLLRNPVDDSRHAFLAQADVQVVSEDELCLYDRQADDSRAHFDDQFPGMDRFALDLGDLVGDHPELYPSCLAHRERLAMPVYCVPGNHDMIYGGRSHESSTSRFEAAVGPVRYSFNRGRVHYVALDNCFYIGREYFYIGYIDETTFNWLEQDLAAVPEGSTVVLFCHIPLRLQAGYEKFGYDGQSMAWETVNADHLFRLLSPYNAHIITGHQHWNRNIEHTPTCFEHNTGSACGTWWDLPVCEDGTPQGYGVYIADGDSLQWYFKSVGQPREYQARAYAPGTVDAYPDHLVANVWNVDSAWRVEWLEDGKLMGEMEQFEGQDPLTLQLTADRSRLRYSWITAASTPHLFRAKPTRPDARLQVRVTDRFGHVSLLDP